LGEYDKQPEPSESLSSIPEDVMCQVLTAFLDGPSWTCLCQVSRRFSELAHNGSDEIDSRIWGFVMNKFDDLICDIREMAVAAETYAEVCDRCRAMVDDAMDPGMADDVHADAHARLFDRVLDRATDIYLLRFCHYTCNIIITSVKFNPKPSRLLPVRF